MAGRDDSWQLEAMHMDVKERELQRRREQQQKEATSEMDAP